MKMVGSGDAFGESGKTHFKRDVGKFLTGSGASPITSVAPERCRSFIFVAGAKGFRFLAVIMPIRAATNQVVFL